MGSALHSVSRQIQRQPSASLRDKPANYRGVMHPLAMEKLEMYEFDEGMEKINWDLLEERDYTDHECKMTCMSEVIFPIKHDITSFFSIVYKN